MRFTGSFSGLRKSIVCFLCVCTLLIFPACNQYQPEISCDKPREWIPVYNVHEHDFFVCSVFPYAFEERLTEEDLVKILPKKPLPFEVYLAKVKFKEDRSVYCVVLYIGSKENCTVMALGEGSIMNYCCRIWNKGEDVSRCGNMEYTLYESDDDLLATAIVHDTPMCARTYGSMSKADFEAVLECFSWYSSGNPKLNNITPKEH